MNAICFSIKTCNFIDIMTVWKIFSDYFTPSMFEIFLKSASSILSNYFAGLSNVQFKDKLLFCHQFLSYFFSKPGHRKSLGSFYHPHLSEVKLFFSYWKNSCMCVWFNATKSQLSPLIIHFLLGTDFAPFARNCGRRPVLLWPVYFPMK